MDRKEYINIAKKMLAVAERLDGDGFLRESQRADRVASHLVARAMGKVAAERPTGTAFTAFLPAGQPPPLDAGKEIDSEIMLYRSLMLVAMKQKLQRTDPTGKSPWTQTYLAEINREKASLEQDKASNPGAWQPWYGTTDVGLSENENPDEAIEGYRSVIAKLEFQKAYILQQQDPSSNLANQYYQNHSRDWDAFLESRKMVDPTTLQQGDPSSWFENDASLKGNPTVRQYAPGYRVPVSSPKTMNYTPAGTDKPWSIQTGDTSF